MLQKAEANSGPVVQANCVHDNDSVELNFAQLVTLKLIKLYQIVLSPWIGRQCRFYPTCSHYSAEAITEHGFYGGVKLTLSRLGRCHPFHPGGVDLVPPNNPQAPR